MLNYYLLKKTVDLNLVSISPSICFLSKYEPDFFNASLISISESKSTKHSLDEVPLLSNKWTATTRHATRVEILSSNKI